MGIVVLGTQNDGAAATTRTVAVSGDDQGDALIDCLKGKGAGAETSMKTEDGHQAITIEATGPNASAAMSECSGEGAFRSRGLSAAQEGEIYSHEVERVKDCMHGKGIDVTPEGDPMQGGAIRWPIPPGADATDFGVQLSACGDLASPLEKAEAAEKLAGS